MTSAEKTISELAMLVRMLVSALKQYDAAHPMAAKATRLLADRGLLGTGLRQEEDSVQLDLSTENEGGFIALTKLQHEAISAAEPRRRGRVVDSLLPQTVARSADYLARRLDAADMAPLSGGLRMGRSAQLIAVDGGPVIALDGGPGRGLVGPLWQFEPAMLAPCPACRLPLALRMAGPCFRSWSRRTANWAGAHRARRSSKARLTSSSKSRGTIDQKLSLRV